MTPGAADAAAAPPPAPRGTLPHILLHHAPHGLPTARVAFADVRVTPDDLLASERLLAAYQRSSAEQRTLSRLPANDVWEIVGNAFHREFLAALRSGDPRALARILSCAYREPITHGLGPGREIYEAALTAEGSESIAALCVDRLAALAEAVGALPIENPEQGRWGVNLYLDPSDLVSRIERAVGASIRPDLGMGYFGIPVDDGLFFVRSAEHVYVAWRCRQLGARRVAEIGAGLAGVAGYARRFGVEDYCIYDLPVMNVVQGYALITSGMPVSLLGEPDAPLRVRPWWHLAGAPRVDLVVNQDSFPEIDRAFVVDYLKQIRACSLWLLSINQEGAERASADGRLQNIVSDVIDEVGGFRRRSRAPYWLRRGYVEELYEVVP